MTSVDVLSLELCSELEAKIFLYLKINLYQELKDRTIPTLAYDDVSLYDGLIDMKYFPKKIVIHPKAKIRVEDLLTAEDFLDEESDDQEDEG